ncbi:hypothetical protein GCM10007301_09430 [Azorhizobium oxalatiphilum]|uniref:Uncharacterized protein n=1 Tax=Azorhizobium oxalatiphilum TaxID=980631 RepID=A0A917BMP3_9HYPH|nr:hypothetical protein [Azorhizobium oxalatiphilum]GGF52075.1 hypothetical protein GCM10007301_09430 [Azorhizobium oxalatiphilum]
MASRLGHPNTPASGGIPTPHDAAGNGATASADASGATTLERVINDVRDAQARDDQARHEQEGRELARLERNRVNQTINERPRITAPGRMRADASPAYRQGASVGTAAWLARVEPSAPPRLSCANPTPAERPRPAPGPDARAWQAAHAPDISEPDSPAPDTETVPAAPDGQNGTRTSHPHTPGLMERIERAGSPQLRALIAPGPDIGHMVRQIARHRHDLNLQRDGERFLVAQRQALAATIGASEIDRLRDGIEIASEVVAGTRDFTNHFPLYLEYVAWAWTCRDTHEVSGQLHVAQPDGSYRVGTFEIRERSTDTVIWRHDGGGTVVALSPAAGQPAEMPANADVPNPLTSMAVVVTAVQQKYPHKMVVNGLRVRTNRAAEPGG